MKIFSDIYRTIEVRLDTSVDGSDPHFSLYLDYSNSPTSLKKNLRDDEKVASAFNIDPECKNGMKDYYPNLLWFNTGNKLAIHSSKLINGTGVSLTLLEYLSAVTRSIDKILDR